MCFSSIQDLARGIDGLVRMECSDPYTGIPCVNHARGFCKKGKNCQKSHKLQNALRAFMVRVDREGWEGFDSPDSSRSNFQHWIPCGRMIIHGSSPCKKTHQGEKYSHDIRLLWDIAQSFINSADKDEIREHRIYIEAVGLEHGLTTLAEEKSRDQASPPDSLINFDTLPSAMKINKVLKWLDNRRGNETQGKVASSGEQQQFKTDSSPALKDQMTDENRHLFQDENSADSDQLKAAKKEIASLATHIRQLKLEKESIEARRETNGKIVKPLVGVLEKTLEAANAVMSSRKENKAQDPEVEVRKS